MIENWGAQTKRDFKAETTPLALRKLTHGECKKLLFDCIRGKDLQSVANVLSSSRHLAVEIMYGYEGSDIHSTIEGGDGRCYFYTELEKDGFFYPIHVAAESGSKDVVLLLARDYHADLEVLDYRQCLPESKCRPTQGSKHAFYELRGMFFAAKERYQGGLSKISGMRHGQGVLFFKPEGFECVEKVLYRGTFKDNIYHGQGAMYWPGSDILQYKGRLKQGEKHGRGVLFDEKGNKIYHGTFRNGKKDGRGELFEATEGRFSRTYHGEFEADQMHGFGVAYYGDAGTFVGRFENGMKAGVGVYAYPNGDRFEGMFFNDKPDGKGSYYTTAENGKSEVGSHFLWQNGRKSSQVDTPFVPDKLDMPDPDEERANGTVMAALAQSDDASLSSIDSGKKMPSSSSSSSSLSSSSKRSSGKESAASQAQAPKTKDAFDSASGKDWKIILGRAVRIPNKTAKTMGMEDPNAVKAPKENKAGDDAGGSKSAGGEQAEEAQDYFESSDEESPDMDDVISSHFLKFPPVFTCYAYVCSASKVFEERNAAERDGDVSVQANTPMIVPEFDSVYHLVMDAVEDYNERWEKAFAELKKIEEAETEASKKNDEDEPQQQGTVSKIKSSNVFMTDAEKRKELKRKQRVELAAKRGGNALDKETEQSIGIAVYENLEKELQELTTDEMQGDDVGGPSRARPKYLQGDREEPEGKESLSNEFATELLYLLRMARHTM